MHWINRSINNRFVGISVGKNSKAVITIAIRLRYDYDPTTTYRAPLLPFDTIRRERKMNMSIFRCSRVVVVSQSNHNNCDIGLRLRPAAADCTRSIIIGLAASDANEPRIITRLLRWMWLWPVYKHAPRLSRAASPLIFCRRPSSSVSFSQSL